MPRAKNQATGGIATDATGAIQRVVRTSAGAASGAAQPSGPTSVFDAARRAKPPRAKTLDPSTVVIRSGVPIPERNGGPSSPYTAVLERMQAGDCVELNDRQAAGLKSRAKAMGIKLVVRKLDNGLQGCWRQ